MLATAFRSPTTDPARTVSIPGSTLPAYRFASCRPLPRPVRPFAPPPIRPVCSGIGGLNALGPLPLPRPALPAALPASTPLWDNYVPPDQSVLPTLPQAGPPSDRARCPITPRRPPSITSCGCGSTFPARYASGGLLFLKPLGTSFTMIPESDFVNLFVHQTSWFPHNS